MELCVALDHPSKSFNLELAKRLAGYPVWLKVGFRSFIRGGEPLIKELKAIDRGFKIFLDLKLYDIPNTMADAAEEIAAMGVEMFNLHASSGKEAMQAVMQRLKKHPKRPLVLAVTALTSFDHQAFKEVYGDTIEAKAERFALFAYQAGLDGVVCSVHESRQIKTLCDENFLTLTPGIRPFGEDRGDQKRVADLSLAMQEHVDIVVVGRPIYQNPDPTAKVREILEVIGRLKT